MNTYIVYISETMILELEAEYARVSNMLVVSQGDTQILFWVGDEIVGQYELKNILGWAKKDSIKRTRVLFAKTEEPRIMELSTDLGEE